MTILQPAAPSVRADSAGRRLVDVLAALGGLVVCAPVLAAVALAVRLDSPGPALFRQTRVGRGTRPFVMYKFRTMVVGAAAAGPAVSGNADPRITRVGAVLRKTKLDELPQLVNVLRGDMSLVGPRPPLPLEVDRYTMMQSRRLRVRPGLTGLWQVSGRSDLSWTESIRLDLYYVDNWSMIQDVVILARTVGAVLSSRGAY